MKPNLFMGNYFRVSTGQILFAIKDSMPLRLKDVCTLFEVPCGDTELFKQDLEPIFIFTKLLFLDFHLYTVFVEKPMYILNVNFPLLFFARLSNV
jgi:hypothetical protein